MHLDAEIADAFQQLNAQLQDNDPRARRDAAQTCYMRLEALRKSAPAEQLGVLMEACERARCTFDALHQDLQDKLEWANAESSFD